MVTVGVLARLEAKPGKEEEVARFLAGALPLAEEEDATTAWFATQLGPSTFGIFDVFPDEAGRDAHLSGPIATALMEKADELLSEPPTRVVISSDAAVDPYGRRDRGHFRQIAVRRGLPVRGGGMDLVGSRSGSAKWISDPRRSADRAVSRIVRGPESGRKRPRNNAK